MLEFFVVLLNPNTFRYELLRFTLHQDVTLEKMLPYFSKAATSECLSNQNYVSICDINGQFLDKSKYISYFLDEKMVFIACTGEMETHDFAKTARPIISSLNKSFLFMGESDKHSDTDKAVKMCGTKDLIEGETFNQCPNDHEMEVRCVSSTMAERRRFLCARKGNVEEAIEQLNCFLDWRKEYQLDDNFRTKTFPDNLDQNVPSVSTNDHISDDEYDWKYAVTKALSLCSPDQSPQSFPRLARFDSEDGNDRMIDSNGKRIMQFLPAQVDSSIATDSTYVTAIGIYLDRKLCRNSDEKITVVIDLRAGEGWANPKAKNIVPLIKQLVKLLERNFPERLHKSILYPFPSAAVFLWKLVKIFIDPDTSRKVVLVPGSSSRESKPPKS
eukprot:CAMPEP_0184864236 /NCGR_PEP_ID=MMETSP0580-20130426/14207_1 /TAXON_ID=1118495 /ORGANISM="Dactyliosolen fragilissimus" /LENGTH=385 /DNA_ID=CAMNT_0027362931 /DNA_START=110 /DNA_END=1264 /DNA_ORIENTATION=+